MLEFVFIYAMLVYDAILGSIPCGFVITLISLLAFGLPYNMAVALGALIASIPIIYGLFIDPPIDGNNERIGIDPKT